MDKRVIPLSWVRENDSAIIRLVECVGVSRERLLAFGVTNGSAVIMLHKSRGVGPSAIGIMGTVLALRAKDLDRVMVEPDDGINAGDGSYA